MNDMRAARRHHVLFNVPDDERLRAALSQIAVAEGIAFRTPRMLRAGACRPPHEQEGDAVPVWRWAGTAEAFRSVAGTVLNELAYPLACSPGGGCLAFPFARSELEPRALRVDQRHLLDAEDVVRLFEEAPSRAGLPAAGDVTAPDAAVGRAPAAAAGLDPDQRAAASHAGGPGRVLAAAGSGKTRTMVARIAALVAGGTPPGSILVLAFNTEAALQLEERLHAVDVPTTRTITLKATGVHCATFNAFGSRFQRQVLGIAPQVTDAEAVRYRLLRTALQPFSEQAAVAPCFAGSPRDAAAVRPYGRVLCAGAAFDPYDAAAADATQELGRTLQAWRSELQRPPERHADAVRRHAQLQASCDLQSFDDQVLATVVALLGDPGHRRLVQSIYRHVLVDEFQDVNPAQWALLDVISRPWRNLFVVGDDDQLIYGWRAARVATIVEFGAGLPTAPFTAYYTLPTNYRCSREIVARAERLVLNNRRRAQKSMQAGPTAPAGAVLFAAAGQSRERYLEAAAFLSLEQVRLACRWHELAVLCRYRSQLVAAAPALRTMGVPALDDEPPAALEPTRAGLLGAALRQAARDHLQASRPAAAVLEEIIERLPDDVASLEAADVARSLVCDHPTVAGLATAWQRLATASGPQAGTGDAVTMATIHATKGREYHSVVVMDFAPALEPLSDDEREEERRVLYVALTRARHRVLLTIDTSRGAPHPFILEMLQPPGRAEVRRLRRELARLQGRLAQTAPALPSAAARLLGAAPGVAGSTAASGVSTGADAGEAAADYLAVRSRLGERRLAARRRLRGVVASWPC